MSKKVDDTTIRMINMITAIRGDEKVGKGTCSVFDECTTDAELAEELASLGITDPGEAVEYARAVDSAYWSGQNY